MKETEITDKQLNNMTKPLEANLLEQSNSVTEVPISEDKDDMGKELILPIELGPEGKALLNLQVTQKATFVPSEPPIKKKKVLATQHATKAKHAKTSTPTEVSREGVLLVTQGGKPIYSLGQVKIGKTVQQQVSSVQGVEKQPKIPASVATKNVVESARTELKPLPDGNPKRSPYVTTIVPKRQVENVMLVTPPSVKQVNKEQGNVKKSACV